MCNLKKDIANFKPNCEQEATDKFYFLEFINTFSDVLTRDNLFGHFSASAWVLNKLTAPLFVVY